MRITIRQARAPGVHSDSEALAYAAQDPIPSDQQIDFEDAWTANKFLVSHGFVMTPVGYFRPGNNRHEWTCAFMCDDQTLSKLAAPTVKKTLCVPQIAIFESERLRPRNHALVAWLNINEENENDMTTKTKLYVLKATNDFDGRNCLFSAYLDEGDAIRALDACHAWQTGGDDFFKEFQRSFEIRKHLDITEKYGLRDLVAGCPVGAHAAIHGMETASIIKMEFYFEVEAMGEMAAIRAEAGIKNVNAMRNL